MGVDQVTYGSLIHAFAKVGQWEAALRFLAEMRAAPAPGVRPNNFVYCSAMSACNRGNEWAVALDLLTQVGGWVERCTRARLLSLLFVSFVRLFVDIKGPSRPDQPISRHR